MKTIYILIFLFVFIIFSSNLEAGFSINGYYKNFFNYIDNTETKETNSYDYNRMRVKIKGDLAEHLLGEVHYELKYIPKEGSPLIQIASSKDNYLDLDKIIKETGRREFSHRLDRAYITYYSKRVEFNIGRQVIGWGTGKIWCPTDLFNSFSPTGIDKEEKTGVDAIDLKLPFGAVSLFDIVYAPKKDEDKTSYVGRYHTNWSKYDFSIIGGKFEKGDIYGGDFATDIFGASLHGEFTCLKPEQKENIRKYVIGGEYATRIKDRNCIIYVEYYYYNLGVKNYHDDILNFQTALNKLTSGEIENLGKYYFSLGVSYNITSLISFGANFLRNIEDKSQLSNFSLNYSWVENVLVGVGASFPSRNDLSEFGRNSENKYYSRLNYYF